MASNNITEALNSYITDMLSVERHINKALESQIKDLEDHPAITGELKSINATVESHIQTLENLTEQYGGEKVAGTIKKVGSAIAGLAAGAIDMVRNEGMPKDIRDDYTAFSLATIGYVMLYTTGASLGDRIVADVAQRHLTDYAEVVMTLHNLTPRAVIEFLQEEGLPAREEALSEISETLENVWKQEAKKVPEADQIATQR
jgi:ferritin-like metal-binding protein YciE